MNCYCKTLLTRLATLVLAGGVLITTAVAQEGPPEAQRLSQLKVTQEYLLDTLGSHLQTLADQDRFSGTVLIAKDGLPIFQAAYGQASEAGEPIEIDTKFPLASLSKMFTAVAVAHLVEEGKLAVDAPVSHYLPDYPAGLIEGVTLHHLLSHTSGLGSFEFAEIQPMRTVDEMLGLKVSRSAFTPGERFHYSNMGYVLLGAVIEAVSGQAYDEYLQATVFTPLGMTNTDAFDLTGDTPGLAIGFTNMIDWTFRTDPQTRRNNQFFRVTRGGPAGDMVSTAKDLLAFANALQEPTLLSAETTDLFTSAKITAFQQPGLQAAYGYGFEVINWDGIVTVGHSGEAAGESTLLRIYPAFGYTVIILANYDAVAHGVGDYIHNLLTQP